MISTTPSHQTWSRPGAAAQPGAQSGCHNTRLRVKISCLHFFIWLTLHCETQTALHRSGRAKSSLLKWKSETTVKSSSKFRYISKGKAGSVFDTLFRPEGKALAKISQAWMAQMKEKKRRCDHRESFNKSHQMDGPISIEKYFDNLVRILYHSTSTISL